MYVLCLQTRRVWSVPMPAGMSPDCRKHQSPDGSIVLQDYDDTKVVQVDGATGKVVTRTAAWRHGRIIAVTTSMIVASPWVDERLVLTLVARSNHTQVGPVLVTVVTLIIQGESTASHI